MFLHEWTVKLLKQEVLVQKGLPFQYQEVEPNLKELSKDELSHLYNEAQAISTNIQLEMIERG